MTASGVGAESPIPTRSWAVLAVCSSVVFLTLLDSGGVFVAFPFIEERFADQASRATLSWIVSGFFIAMVSCLLVAGRIADRYGRRETFLAGLALYGAGAVAAGAADSVWLMIGARAVQGIGVSLLSPSALALALPGFPVSRRAYALGVWGTIGAVAGLVATPLGAVLLELTSWRGVFFFNGAVALVSLGVGARVLDGVAPDSDPRPIDLVGALLGTASVAGLTLVLVQGNDWGWSSPATLVAAAVTAAAGPAFVRRNHRHPTPLLDQSIFASRRFTVASIASVCCQLGFFSVYFGLPLYMEEVWDWSPLRIGLGILPLSAVPVLTAAAAGRLVDRHGPRGMIAFGGVLAFASFMAMGFWLTEAGYVWLALGLFASGLGTMAIGNHTTVAALHGIDDRLLGAANAAYFLTRRIGSALGAVAVAAIVGNRSGSDFADIYPWVWVFGAVAYLVGGVAVWFFYPASDRADSMASELKRGAT